MYLSGFQKLVFFTVTVSAMLLGYQGWGVEGFLAGLVLSALFLMWCHHRIRNSRRPRPTRVAPTIGTFGAFDYLGQAPKSDIEWDPNIKLPVEYFRSDARQAVPSDTAAARSSSGSTPSFRDTLEPHL
jgi:hypothetical protein